MGEVKDDVAEQNRLDKCAYYKAWRIRKRNEGPDYAESEKKRHKQYRIDNPHIGKEYFKKNKSAYKARAAKRRFVKLRNTPVAPWYDDDAVKAIYDWCNSITDYTGVNHHVDHIFPLQCKTVCGLHVQANLQIIPAEDNLSKNNKLEFIPESLQHMLWDET